MFRLMRDISFNPPDFSSLLLVMIIDQSTFTTIEIKPDSQPNDQASKSTSTTKAKEVKQKQWQVWWLISVIPALGSLRQEDGWESGASLGFI